jgi:beta-N-acetylhexosaminidase
MFRSKGLCILFLVILLTAFVDTGKNISSNNPDPIEPPFLTFMHHHWVDSVMNELSLDEQIAQLLMVAAYSNRDDDHKKDIIHLVEKYNIGGLIFFQGNPNKQALLTNDFQQKSKTPLLIAMDAEWGLGMRLNNTINYPKNMMLGAVSRDKHIYDLATDIAMQCKRLGVHINFAPVADINTDKDNPVINTRSFGENKHRVTSKSLAYMHGLQDNNIMATAKHFPGHGDTKTDSHKALPVITKSYEEMDSVEFFPFRQLINQGICNMMIAHLHIPGLDSSQNIPSTLSPVITDTLLKQQMGFKGLVISDALNMRGVSDHFRSGEKEVKALLAGNDILLMPDDVSKTIRYIKKALNKGELSEEIIAYRCRKVLAAKYWAGLHNYQPVDTVNLHGDLNSPAYKYTFHRLTEEALTLVKNDKNLLPLQALDTLKIASVVFGSDNVNAFQRTLERYTHVTHFNLPFNATQRVYDSVFRQMDNYNMVLAGVVATHAYPPSYGINNVVVSRINELGKNKNMSLTLFANPYALSKFNANDYNSIVVAYQNHPVIMDYAAQLIFGGISANGALPVTASETFKEGMGLTTEKTRLKYAVPEDVGADRACLQKVDSIIKKAIEIKATPGCQVLAARKGVVFYHHAAGYHDYNNEQPVSVFDLYDLASVTKIIATLPVLMHLQENKRFDVNHTLADYLKELENTNKESLVIKDILAHQGRLKPWIPFYRKYIELLGHDEKIFSNDFSFDFPFILDKNLFLNRNYKYREGVFDFCNDGVYSVKVADRFYMDHHYIDTMYKMINETDLYDKKEYVYSDLGYYYFYKIMEKLIHEPLDAYVQQNYYHPMGMNRTSYLPLQYFSKNEITPTQNDVVFRKQLLHGYVHDPGCAMLGGVCGHAGVFGNANDLAKMMQMYVNGGEYGKKRYFDSTTIALFASAPFLDNDNRRGIGFDKPAPNKVGPTGNYLSLESFGHTGYTGTMAWADPVEDIVYIFLSNRIYPNEENKKLVEENIRTAIHEMLYKSLDIEPRESHE